MELTRCCIYTCLLHQSIPVGSVVVCRCGIRWRRYQLSSGIIDWFKVNEATGRIVVIA
jgi:hypothetical protein